MVKLPGHEKPEEKGGKRKYLILFSLRFLHMKLFFEVVWDGLYAVSVGGRGSVICDLILLINNVIL